jgi:hypothetical protein
VTRVYTTDVSDVEKTSFAAGQTVRLNVDRMNSLSSQVTVEPRYKATGPASFVLLDTVFPASTAPVGTQSRFVDVPIPQSAPTGTYTFEASITYNGTTSSKSTTFTVTAAGTGTKPFAQTQTERLIGTWQMTFTVTSTTTRTYRLNDVQPSSASAGEWVIFGLDATNGIVVGQYSTSLAQFTLYDPGTTVDDFFLFDFTGTSTVSGCHYQSPAGTTNLGACHAMTGIRTSTSTQRVAFDEIVSRRPR